MLWPTTKWKLKKEKERKMKILEIKTFHLFCPNSQSCISFYSDAIYFSTKKRIMLTKVWNRKMAILYCYCPISNFSIFVKTTFNWYLSDIVYIYQNDFVNLLQGYRLGMQIWVFILFHRFHFYKYDMCFYTSMYNQKKCWGWCLVQDDWFDTLRSRWLVGWLVTWRMAGRASRSGKLINCWVEQKKKKKNKTHINRQIFIVSGELPPGNNLDN